MFRSRGARLLALAAVVACLAAPSPAAQARAARAVAPDPAVWTLEAAAPSRWRR
jgi:hypothetical protein